MKRMLSYCAVLALVPVLAFAADTGKSSASGTAVPAAVKADTKADTKVDTKVDAGKKSEAPQSDAVKSDSAVKTEGGKDVKSEAAPVKTTTVAKAKTTHKAVHKAVIKAKPAETNDSKVETPKS